MCTKIKQRVLSSVTVFALMLTLFAGLPASVSAASGYWTDANNYDTSWYTVDPTADAYTIDNEAEFAGLAALVNGTAAGVSDPVTFAGVTLTLTADLDLSAHYWYPIGGVSPIDAGVPTGNYFAGVFDGFYSGNTATYNTHAIGGIYIEYITTDPVNNSGYGLFGCVKGGKLLNLTLAGNLDLEGNDVSGVGALVGYTNGDIYNIHNTMPVYMGNSRSSMLGGVAGTVENRDTGKIVMVQYCSNTGEATGRGRVGGIVGAVYCSAPGGVVVDNCYNSATLNTIGTAIQSYLGGVVGYCQGYISNSYAANTTITTKGGHNQGGVAGLLQGGGPQAGMFNCYAAVTFLGDTSERYDRALVATVDGSDTLLITDSLYDSTLAGVYTNLPGTGDNGWGWWTDSGYATTADFISNGDADIFTTQEPPEPPLEGSLPVLKVLGPTYRGDTTPPINGGYPILTWQTDGVPPYDPTPVLHGIYLDGVHGYDGNDGESEATAVAHFARAKELLAETGLPAVIITDTVTVNSGEIWTLAGGQKVIRNNDFTGDLVNVVTGGQLDLNDITIEGNEGSVPNAQGALVKVRGGTLNLRTGAVLRNNSNIGDGGGVNLIAGTVNVSGGSVYSNAAANGAGIFFGGGVLDLRPQSVTLTDEIYLADDQVIDVSSSLSGLTDALTIRAEIPYAGLVVADGADSYTLTADDTRRIVYAGDDGWFVVHNALNQAVLAQEVGAFLDGVNGDDGNSGTSRTSAVKTLGAALSVLSGSGTIYSLDTVTVTGAVDDSAAAGYDVTLMRSTTSVTPMFDVRTGGGLKLSFIDLDGNYADNYWNSSSLIRVSGGDLLLGGANLRNNNATDGGALNISTGTATLTEGLIEKNTAIRGGAALVDAGATFEQTGGAMQNNVATSAGGAVRVGGGDNNPGVFRLTNGLISGNENSGVYVMENGAFYMDGGTITLNTTFGNGGGVYLGPRCRMEMTGGVISHNMGSNGGGGIYDSASGGTVLIKGGSIEENETEYGGNGGGINIAPGANFTASGGSVTGNTASGSGGGIYSSSGMVLDFSGLTVTDNEAVGDGGGIYKTSAGTATANKITITGNSAGGNGGGLYLPQNTGFTINGGVIAGNSAAGNGGGVYTNAGPYGDFVINAATIASNTATLGTGIYVVANDSLTLTPNGSGVISFGTGTDANDIYLPNTDGTTAGQVAFNIDADLGTGVSGTIPIALQIPIVEGIVAIASTSTIASSSVSKLVPIGTFALDADDVYIYIAHTRLE